MSKILVAPSILSADFSRLKEEIKKIEDSGADWVHIDVMDGHFVPNITIGPLIVEVVKRCTLLPLDVHLMIEEPNRFIKEFSDAGSDIITVHAEAYPLEVESREKRAPNQRIYDIKSFGSGQVERMGTSRSVEKINEYRIKEVLRQIKSLGKKAGLSLNPDSPFCIQGVLKEVDMLLIMSVHPGFGGQKFIQEVLPKVKSARRTFSGDIEVDGGINDKNVRLVIDAGANIMVAGAYFFGAEDPKEAVRKLRLLR